MRFPAKKNAGCPKAPCDFPPRKDGILCPPSGCLGTPLPLPQSVRTDGRTDVRMYGRTDGRSRDYYVTTKISRIDRLPYFLSNGAPLAGFARRLRHNFPRVFLLQRISPVSYNKNYLVNKDLFSYRYCYHCSMCLILSEIPEMASFSDDHLSTINKL